MTKMVQTNSTIPFKATLVRLDVNGQNDSRNALNLPESATAKLPQRGETMVEGVINAFPFRAALEPVGNGGHRLIVSEAICNGARADADDEVMVEITRVGEEPETRLPKHLRNSLGGAPAAQDPWEDITPLARRDWILWITTAKKSETRKRRIKKACDMLASGKRRVCCFPGLKWLTKDHVTSDETWHPLPQS